MIVIASPDEMTRYAESARQTGEHIGLVPTMGFLHDGHLTLMREGRRQSSVLVASIFVTINLIVDMLYAVVDPRIRIDARPA